METPVSTTKVAVNRTSFRSPLTFLGAEVGSDKILLVLSIVGAKNPAVRGNSAGNYIQGNRMGSAEEKKR